MSEWRECKLGDLIEVHYGKDHKKLADGNIPAYGSAGLMRFVEKSLSEIPSILIPRKGTLNNVMYSMAPFWTVDTMFWCTIQNPDQVDLKFLYYQLKLIDFLKLNVGSAVPSLTVPVIHDQDIKLPSLLTQRKIAAALGALDDKIELNRKMNANLEAMAQALFKSWFVDFEPFGGQMPEGWRMGRLEEIAKITMGQSPDGSTLNEEKNGIVFYQGRAEFGSRFPTVRLYTTAPNRMAYVGDILLSVRAPVGDLNIAYEDCCIGRGLSAIKSTANCQSYLYYLLKTKSSDFAVYDGAGTVFGSINKQALHALEVLIPTQDLMEKFESLCCEFDSRIKVNDQQIRTLAQLRDTLLPKLMSGELNVDDVKID